MSTPGTNRGVLEVSDEQIVIGEGVALDVRPAGFLLRAASGAIDAIAAYLLYIICLIVVINVVSSPLGGRLVGDSAMVAALAITLVVVCFVVVPAVVETVTHGRSLGRWIMGLRIVRDDGGASGPRQAFIRAVVGVLEIFMTSGGIALLVGLVNPRAKRLGDLLAGTYAQNERAPRSTPLLDTLPPGLERWALVADVARLPDRLSRRVRDYLLQAPKLEPGVRAALAGRVAREVRHYVHPVPDVDADTFLRAVAVVRRDREYTALQLRARRLQRVEPLLEGLPHGFPHRG